MTKIYCVKCREFTDSKSEKFVTTANGRTRLAGICKTCNTKKGVFVNKNRGFHRKTDEEIEEATNNKLEKNLKKKALAIGYKALYDEDTKKCVINCLPEHIRKTPKKKKEKID